jgi:glycerol transport system substrate-binding protein
MKLRYTALAAAMVLALSACGKKDEPAAQAPASTAAPAPAPAAVAPAAAPAAPDAAAKWIDSEFQPSTLSKAKQAEELKWFVDAAAKLKAKGVSEISVVSETITTHEYESKTLARAFEEITGIKVKHDLIQEGDVVEKLQTSMQSGKSIYDGWISDSDLIGTHYRYGR